MAIGQGHAVDTDIVSVGSGKAANLAADAQGTVNAMLGRLSGVVWKGEGANAFTGACERMSGDLTRINDALNWLSSQLGRAGGDYDTADVAGAQTVNSATADAGGIGAALRA